MIVGAVLVDNMLAGVLFARMPNKSNSVDPLSFEGVPLGITPMAKWAYALGGIDRRMYDACRILGKLRNDAAHLTGGPVFKLNDAPYSDSVDRLWDKATPSAWQLDENYRELYDGYPEIERSDTRVRFDYSVLYLGLRLELIATDNESKT